MLTDIHSHHFSVPNDSLRISNILNVDRLEEYLAGEGLFSVGIHPWHIHPDHWEDDIAIIKENMANPKILALGEAGLDRLIDLPLNIQQDVFMSMIELSEEAQKPLIIHCVRSFAELASLHRAVKPKQKWIIHGFNMRWEIAKGLLDQDFYFSFGSAILHHKSAAALALAQMPSDRFFLETDESHEPLDSIFAAAAKIRGVNEHVLSDDLFGRFKELFNYG